MADLSDEVRRLTVLPSPPKALEGDQAVLEQLGHKKALHLLSKNGVDVNTGYLINKLRTSEISFLSGRSPEVDAMINERQSYTGDTTECCFYIPDLRSSTIFGFKWADGRSTSTKNVTVASILKQLGLIHTIVEPLATESSAKITIIYFLFVDYLCPELGPKSDSMIQQMVAEIEAECRSFVNLDVNIRATASTNATEFVGIHLKITLDSLQSQQPNELARSVITNSVLEYDLGVTKNSLHFEDTNLTPVKIDKQGMERLTETYFGNIGTKMIYIPDMDRIDFTKLYATGEVPGGIPDHVVKQFEGELVLFRRELTRWLSEDKSGLLLYSYSAKELKNIVHSQVQNQFEFDWLLFRKSQIVAIEVTASGNIRQAVHDKLEQVMTKTIPMMKILIWFFLANDTENFSWILEKNVFEEFMRKHLKIIVFVASASSEDIKTAMTSVLSENFQEESNLKLKFEKSSISTYFVGGQDYGPNERPKFLQFLLNQESKNVEIKVSDKSPLITNSQKTSSSNELETIKFLAGTFTVGYLCHDSDKICRLKSDALDPDVRFLESQKKFVDKLVRKATKKLEKYVHISEKLTVILSPQQMKILEEDPNYLLVRGEPGAGKTVLLLAKALECSLDEKVRYIYFCLPHTKQHLKVFIEKFRDFHTDTLGGKFRILSDASSDFIELSKKPFKELHDSVLLIDEFYFDCSEKMRITSFLFHQISASIFPHMKNVWMTSVAIAFFEPSMDLMKEYLPLELFCIKPLNVNFRNSVHIATFCTNYHHRGGVRAFASSYVPGVFTSSEIEIQLSTFKDKIDISFENLSCKFRKSRWVIIFCDELHFGSWHTFLANRESEFSDSFVIQTNGSPTMCDFSGAEVHSVVLIVDPFFTKNQKEVEISEAMYKLAASRAQYELVLFVHQDMKTVLNDFSQSRNFQLDINPEQVRILATDDPDGSKFVDTLYNLARGYLSRERLQSFIEARYPGLNPKLFHDYVAEEKNRRVFILLLKHMGQGIIKFFLQCSRVLTSGEEICGIRFQETDEEYYRDIIKDIVNHALLMNSTPTFDWISRLIDQTQMQRALQGNPTQILSYSCFRPALMKKCWNKMKSWNLLEPGLESRAKLWNQECGILTLMCYANCAMQDENSIPKTFWGDKLQNKNALQYAIEHGNMKTVRKLVGTKESAWIFLNPETSYDGKTAVQFARDNQFDDIADILSKKKVKRIADDKE